MTLLSAWALAGLVLLAPLIALHLRGRRLPRRETASLIGWRSLDATAAHQRRRLRRPPLPLLLALQALALILLVVGLARPSRGADEGAAARVYVLDDSIWMQARDGDGGTRLNMARRLLEGRLDALDPETPVRVVVATADPVRRFAGGAREVARSLARIEPTDGAADLGAAVRLAAALRTRPTDPIELLHAPENPVPEVVTGGRGSASGGGAGGGGSAGSGVGSDGGVAGGATAGGAGSGSAGAGGRMAGGAGSGNRAAGGSAGAGAGGSFRATVVGERFDDLGLVGVRTRCGLPDGGCELLARVASTAAAPIRARVDVLDGERTASSTSVEVPARGSAPVVFRAPAGARLELRLAGGDALLADDVGYAVTPAAATVHVTVLGGGAGVVPLVGALAAIPGVVARLRTPQTYRPADARESDLLVVDGPLPGGGLPQAAALLLVHPSRLPGGVVAGHLADARVAGTDATSPLLRGVDLTSLALDPAAVERVRLPRWMTPAAWARGGPLLASGTDGGQRVALLTFDPADSTLPQLAGFPQLVSNLLAWSQAWLPAQSDAGTAIAVEQPPGTRDTTLAQRDADGAGTTRQLPRGTPQVAIVPSAGIVTGTQVRGGGAGGAGAAGGSGARAAGGSGSGGASDAGRVRALAVEPVATPILAGPPIDLADPAGAASAGPGRPSLAPWLLAAALVVLLAELALGLRPSIVSASRAREAS